MACNTSTNANNERCATCQYWQGEREVFFASRTNVLVRYNNRNEDCVARRTRPSGGTPGCDRYKRWVELP